MAPKPWPVVVDALYGDVPNGLFPAKDTTQQLVLLPFGGLQELCTLTDCTEVREGWSWNGYMYWLAKRGGQSVLWRVDETGTFAELGTITTSTTGPAWIRNNQTQLCVVDGVSGYVHTPATNGFVQITDEYFLGASSLEYQDGYGLFSVPGSNQWFFSAINNFLTGDPLDFYSKQALTDNISSIRSFKREPYIFGTDKGTELWYNAGGDNSSAQNPTFARNTGGLINYGLAAPKAVDDMDGTVMTWLSRNGQIIQAAGTTAGVKSNQMFDREVAGDGSLLYPGYSTIADCLTFSYRDQGHIFQQFTFPTADATWILDGTTGLLLKRQSYKASGGYGRHRANCYIRHNNKHYVGDFENGKIYEMSAEYLDDDGHEINRVLYSHDINGGKSLISFPNIQVLVEAGHGLPAGADPQIGLEFSPDGGRTWSNMVNRSVGVTGQYQWQANWNELGSAYRRMYRLTMTDPIIWKIIGIDFGIE
jgi:hypothetical protein